MSKYFRTMPVGLLSAGQALKSCGSCICIINHASKLAFPSLHDLFLNNTNLHLLKNPAANANLQHVVADSGAKPTLTQMKEQQALQPQLVTHMFRQVLMKLWCVAPFGS
jgi:hypothetical protein